MNAAEEYTSETTHRNLAAGILKQAAQDLRRFHSATSTVERELYSDAYTWLTSDDFSWPFSFLNVCQLLNLVPEIIREELLGDLSFGFFGYWIRRCGRALHRFQIFLTHVFTNSNRGEPITFAGGLS